MTMFLVFVFRCCRVSFKKQCFILLLFSLFFLLFFSFSGDPPIEKRQPRSRYPGAATSPSSPRRPSRRKTGGSWDDTARGNMGGVGRCLEVMAFRGGFGCFVVVVFIFWFLRVFLCFSKAFLGFSLVF